VKSVARQLRQKVLVTKAVADGLDAALANATVSQE
jgi:hypothetical protein